MYKQPPDNGPRREPAAHEPARRDPDPSSQKPKHGILAVDDEPRIVQLLRRELGREYKVFTATAGSEALEILEAEDITLVIADQRMPEMSGSELMEKVVERRPDIIRILLTGYTDLNALVDAVNRGQIYYYVTKPWEPDELKIIVRQGIEKFDLEERNRELIGGLKNKNRELFEALEILKKTQHDLLRAERLSTIGKLTNMIVHDLKNPLTSILGLSSLLKSMPEMEAQKRGSYYRLIHEESSRILQMVQEILQFVRGGRPEIHLKPCSLAPYLEEVREELEAFLKDSGIRFRMDVDASSDQLLDPEQMKRVLYNLAANAREAMDAGGDLCITVAENAQHLLLRISDTGRGIPPEFQQSIFEPFFTRGKNAGNGMGLAIVKQIIQAHDGDIELESSGASGSTFCIRLPQRQESADADHRELSASA